MLMEDLVEKVRSRINGSFTEELNALGDDYNTGDPSIELQYQDPSIKRGHLISAGLNTFYVLGSTDGRTIQVLPRADGSFDNNLIANTRVISKPRHTTWAIFRELSDQIVNMGSPYNGIYQPVAFTAAVDWYNGTYPLPEDWQEDELQPMKFLRARYRRRGHDNWGEVENYIEWNVEQWQVEIRGDQPDTPEFEFTFAFPFRRPQSLQDDVSLLGMTEQTTQDIPTLGAAANLFLGGEGRRMQPKAQGDPRRAGELPMTSSTSVAAQWRATQERAIINERSRLIKLFGAGTKMAIGY